MLIEVLDLIDKNDIQALSNIFEKGCHCEYYYLIRASMKGTLETYKLIEQYCHVAKYYPYSEKLLNNAIKSQNLPLIKYLVEEKNMKLKSGIVELDNVESEEILLYLKPYIMYNINLVLRSLVNRGNWKTFDWITKNFNINEANLGFYCGQSKYLHDNKLSMYRNRQCVNCHYCVENKIELLWNNYKNREGLIDWLPLNLVRAIEKKLAKEAGRLYYMSLGPTGPTGPPGPPGAMSGTVTMMIPQLS